MNSLFFWRELLTVVHIKIAAAVCFLLAAFMMAVGIVKRASLWRNVAIIPLLAWGVFVMSLCVDPHQATLRDAVITEESQVFTADSTSSPPRLSKPLPSGAELKLVDQRDRWSELQLPDGRTGWVLSHSVARLGNTL